MDDAKDLILLVGLGVLVLIGVFATELAGESWDLVQAEVAADEQRRKLAGEQAADAEAEAAAEGWTIGPLNSSATKRWVLDRVPQGVKGELAEVRAASGRACACHWPCMPRPRQERSAPAARAPVTPNQACGGRRRRRSGVGRRSGLPHAPRGFHLAERFPTRPLAWR